MRLPKEEKSQLETAAKKLRTAKKFAPQNEFLSSITYSFQKKSTRYFKFISCLT